MEAVLISPEMLGGERAHIHYILQNIHAILLSASGDRYRRTCKLMLRCFFQKETMTKVFRVNPLTVLSTLTDKAAFPNFICEQEV